MSIMLCGLCLVWRKFCSEIFFNLSIRYSYNKKRKTALPKFHVSGGRFVLLA